MLRWVVHLKSGPKRFRHAAVAVGHRVYSFGGYCGRETYMYNMGQIDVHVFNTVSLHWMELPPVTKGEHPLEVPYMRWGHTAVLLEDIFIWGGFTYTRKYCSVLYAFDVDTHRWFTPKTSGTVPGARCGHSACVLRKAMYVFGGFNWQTRCTNDIHKLDTTTMVWSLINTRGTPAPGSSCHSATIIGTKMFVFGGQGDQFDYNNNISVFDTENSSWMITPYAQALPEGRRGHSAFAFNGELYIFGGHKFLLDWTFNDLWKFNPETLYWKKVEPKGKGLCSWMFWMCCCCMIGDRIILFGEYTQPPDVQVYILDLSPSLKTLCKLAVMQYGLEQSGLPHDIRWELTAMTTYSNRIKSSPPIDDSRREQVPGNGTEETERRGGTISTRN